MTEAPPIRAVIYARVSKDDGTTEGASSTERQIQDCRMLAALRRYDVISEEVDQGISAYGGKERPAWETVLGMVGRGEVDIIVAWHVDRMTRNMVDLERLILLTEAHGVGVATVTGDMDLTTDTGRMVARILAAVARAEVERKGERQKRANRSRRDEGVAWKSGWRSFGYTLQGDLVPEEAALIRETSSWILENVSLREVARRWQASGLSTPRSGKGADGWTHSGVKAVLRNPKIAGFMTYKGEIVGDGAWEPILNRDEWALLAAKLNDPARNKSGGRGRASVNLLSGIATCGVCDQPVVGGTRSVQKVQGGKRVQVDRVAVYKCPSDHISTDREAADNAVITDFRLLAASSTPGLLLSLPKRGESVELMQAVDRKREELTALGQSYAAGKLPLVAFEAASTKMQADLDTFEAKAHSSSDGDYDPRRLHRESLERFESLDIEGKRAWLRKVTRISLHPRGKGNRRGATPIREQISMEALLTYPERSAPGPRGTTGGSSRWVTLIERPSAQAASRSQKHYADLAAVLVDAQPEGITSLAAASQWLFDNGHTERKPSGLQGKLSPLVGYVSGGSSRSSRWTRKASSTHG